MRQIRVTKVSRTQRRRDTLLDALPLDPRDPDIVRAKQRQRDGDDRTPDGRPLTSYDA
jgi:hypothetical protein